MQENQSISIHALLAESDITRGQLPTPKPHFYPRSPCGERPHCYQQTAYFFYFYPRSPCGERPITITITCIVSRFLSTLSLRRATDTLTDDVSSGGNFYPRSPCGERRARRASRQHPAGISIHALLAESDSITITITCIVSRFLSTLSLRRATVASVLAVGRA